MSFQSVNPATGEVEASLPEHTPTEIDRALAEAADVFPRWRRTTFEQRGVRMHRAAAYLREHKARFAGLITAEMGKPIRESEAEIEKCAWGCDYYADNAEQFLSDIEKESSASKSYVAFDPLGTVLAIMPWNFPFWQVFRFAAPTLMAGNTAVLKHAANVPRCAMAIEEVFREADFPFGAFRTLLVPSGGVRAIIEDPRIHAVTLTGSDIAGSRVAEESGRVLKKTVLELGGSDPFIVLPDADLEAAAATAVSSRYQNTGQSCIAAKRLIVVDEVADEFTTRFVEGVQRLRIGDPMDPETQIGPLARDDLRDQLERQVQQSLEQGASLVAGGHRIERQGYFYAPTVVTGVTEEMPMFREETFGPAAAVIRALDATDAVALANRSQYGLGANLWTRDMESAQFWAREIESGSVFVNGMVASDPRLPFGGVKRSGYGRELSEFGIREFVNIKTVWIGPAKSTPVPRAE